MGALGSEKAIRLSRRLIPAFAYLQLLFPTGPVDQMVRLCDPNYFSPANALAVDPDQGGRTPSHWPRTIWYTHVAPDSHFYQNDGRNICGSKAGNMRGGSL